MCAGKLIKIRWGFNLKKNFFIAVLALAEISTARALTWPGEEISPLMLAQVENVKRPGDMRTDEQYQADCAAGISLSSCGTMVNPRDCDPGKHWTKLGLGYFHCVVDDMDCGSGATLVHDFKGNASCEVIVCPPRYQPVIIKVWPTASPNKAVSARFNCEASGAAMSPFTIDSRG